MYKIKYYVLAIVLILALAFPIKALDIPISDGFVTDLAGMLTKTEEEVMEKKLQDYGKGSKQIAVLIIPSLEGENIDEFGTRIAQNWGVGGKKNDSGVLITIAKEDRKLRIDVGYGLEGALPDGLCGWIIRSTITPKFKEEKFNEGILAGITKIQEAIAGEYTMDDVTMEQEAEAQAEKKMREMILWFFLLIVLLIIAGFVGILSKIASGIFGGVGAPIVTAWILNPGWGILILMILCGVSLGYFATDFWRLAGDLAGEIADSSSSGSSGDGGGTFFGGGTFGGGGASGGW